MISYTESIGIMAGVLTTISFLPQVIRATRTKSTRDISFGMYLIFSTGVFLWFVYGVLIGSLPVILANGITFLLATVILILKIRYK